MPLLAQKCSVRTPPVSSLTDHSPMVSQIGLTLHPIISLGAGVVQQSSGSYMFINQARIYRPILLFFSCTHIKMQAKSKSGEVPYSDLKQR